jgi:hypothetical protein
MAAIVQLSAKGLRSGLTTIQSDLFAATWKKQKAAMDPDIVYETSFVSREAAHFRKVSDEFARRTKLLDYVDSYEFRVHAPKPGFLIISDKIANKKGYFNFSIRF